MKTREPFLAAIVQTCTPNSVLAAREQLEPLIRAAAKDGAAFIATPEGSNILERDREKFARECPIESDNSFKWYGELARELGVHLLIGSALMQRENQKAANRSLLYGPNGVLIAQYDKIHLFDVNLGVGQELQESKTYLAGARAICAETQLGKIGLSICYDVRFPHLYRALAQNGAQILTIPAAFTVPTGSAHWEVLLRARAIETGSFVIAPAQAGTHSDGRQTYGHSMIIAPWGEVLAQMDGNEIGYRIAQIDLSKSDEARKKIPAWQLNQGFELL